MTKVILGGGLGGLSSAFYLSKKFPNSKITVYESSKRVGGWILSEKQENGVIFEQGPRTLRTAGEPGTNTLQLLSELELENQIVPIRKDHPAARNRLIYANGHLNKVPSSIQGALIKQRPFSKSLIASLFQEFRQPKKIIPENDEPLYDFVHRRFGSEIADYLVSPLVAGICAGDAKNLSVHFLLKSLFEMEQTYGSITSGMIRNIFKKKQKSTRKLPKLAELAKSGQWSVYSFRNGMETVPRTLEEFIQDKGVEVLLNTKIEKIGFSDSKVTLKLADGKTVETDHLVSAIPSKQLASLLPSEHSVLAELLKGIIYNSVIVVNLCFNRKLIRKDAFGFLVAPKENLPILGVVYDSCCFPVDDNTTVFTVMMGGYRFDEYFSTNTSNQYIIQVAMGQLRHILKFTDEPVISKVRILRNCIPQYTVGHYKRVTLIEKYIKDKELNVSLCGSSYYGVGMNDVILSAFNAVENIKH